MLAPGMLQSVADNENLFESINIFELSKTYLKEEENQLPVEINHLNITIATNDQEKAFFELKGVAEALLQKLNIQAYEIKVEEGNSVWGRGQMTELVILGKVIGQIGMVNQEILHLFGIKKSVAMAELDFEALSEFINPNPVYIPIAKFPGIELDLSVEVNTKTSYGEIAMAVREVNSLIEEVNFLSEYRGDKVTEGTKGLAIRITYKDKEKTLKLEEAQAVHEKVVAQLKKLYNIKVRYGFELTRKDTLWKKAITHLTQSLLRNIGIEMKENNIKGKRKGSNGYILTFINVEKYDTFGIQLEIRENS